MCEQDLYGELDQRELASVAGKSILSVDDVRQEARLICWSVCCGTTDYDPAQGTLRQYVMGRLWGLAKRYAPGVSYDAGHSRSDSDGDGLVALHWLDRQQVDTDDRAHLVSPLETLINAEIESEAERTQSRRIESLLESLPPAERSLAKLILAGATTAEIADILGITHRAGRYRLERLHDRIADEIGNLKLDSSTQCEGSPNER